MEKTEMLIYLKSGELQKEATVRKFRTVHLEGKALTLVVKCNLIRFSKDFMFQLAKDGFEGLRFHFATSKSRRGIRYLLCAFTEQVVAVLCSK
ncbi:MAG: ORF6N domain-containing protein [Williamsia sp.]|nr:ORF6N domain-containing protein [Williamsia sp.]